MVSRRMGHGPSTEATRLNIRNQSI
jgi:hypothetical protein